MAKARGPAGHNTDGTTHLNLTGKSFGFETKGLDDDTMMVVMEIAARNMVGDLPWQFAFPLLPDISIAQVT